MIIRIYDYLKSCGIRHLLRTVATFTRIEILTDGISLSRSFLKNEKDRVKRERYEDSSSVSKPKISFT